MILLIDNYDSFTYNLVQAIGGLGYADRLRVVRNDAMTVDELCALSPIQAIISPGPGRPDEAGVSIELIKRLAGKASILGVCLGHQCIARAFGGNVTQASRLVHGKTSTITHDGKGVFAGVPSSFLATRYHSLIVDKATLPDVLEATARSERGELMALRHRNLPIEGVQFHPESFMTQYGGRMIKNFLLSVTG